VAGIVLVLVVTAGTAVLFRLVVFLELMAVTAPTLLELLELVAVLADERSLLVAYQRTQP
jgi:hypothetical protein